MDARLPGEDLIEAGIEDLRGGRETIAALLVAIVRASLPLDKGLILDPFMGSGSTIAAATACGLSSIGLEVRQEYFQMAQAAIPKLAVYQRKDMKLIGGKAVPRNGD